MNQPILKIVFRSIEIHFFGACRDMAPSTNEKEKKCDEDNTVP